MFKCYEILYANGSIDKILTCDLEYSLKLYARLFGEVVAYWNSEEQPHLKGK